MSTEDIQHAVKVKRYQIEECGSVRPWNIRNCDIHTFRLLRRELRARGVEA
ncbi:hypothetical protein ACIRLA_28720 [Streptomyces sp. NPDC102364]|uniref:hypothetical protein n=1 Tax=Streptomyces sp. NPDC102364 TaxID=3366161 RepID=UPI003808EEED